jgi:hypothetical protein
MDATMAQDAPLEKPFHERSAKRIRAPRIDSYKKADKNFPYRKFIPFYLREHPQSVGNVCYSV